MFLDYLIGQLGNFLLPPDPRQVPSLTMMFFRRPFLKLMEYLQCTEAALDTVIYTVTARMIVSKTRKSFCMSVRGISLVLCLLSGKREYPHPVLMGGTLIWLMGGTPRSPNRGVPPISQMGYPHSLQMGNPHQQNGDTPHQQDGGIPHQKVLGIPHQEILGYLLSVRVGVHPPPRPGVNKLKILPSVILRIQAVITQNAPSSTNHY